MSITDRFKNSRIAEFWLKYKDKIILTAGIVLIAAVSFEAGFLQGQRNQQEPVIINKAAATQTTGVNDRPTQSGTDSLSNPSAKNTAISGDITAPNENPKCAYVASKNSNKYHLATCQFAQKIKPENKVCFASVDEAMKRGYQGAKCCIK